MYTKESIYFNKTLIKIFGNNSILEVKVLLKTQGIAMHRQFLRE